MDSSERGAQEGWRPGPWGVTATRAGAKRKPDTGPEAADVICLSPLYDSNTNDMAPYDLLTRYMANDPVGDTGPSAWCWLKANWEQDIQPGSGFMEQLTRYRLWFLKGNLWTQGENKKYRISQVGLWLIFINPIPSLPLTGRECQKIPTQAKRCYTSIQHNR